MTSETSPLVVHTGEPLLESAGDLSCRNRIEHGLVMPGQFMHLDRRDERHPSRWTPVEDGIQITRHLRGVEIQQINIHLTRYILARHLQIVGHYSGQTVHELRIAFPDFLSQFYGSLSLWNR